MDLISKQEEPLKTALICESILIVRASSKAKKLIRIFGIENWLSVKLDQQFLFQHVYSLQTNLCVKKSAHLIKGKNTPGKVDFWINIRVHWFRFSWNNESHKIQYIKFCLTKNLSALRQFSAKRAQKRLIKSTTKYLDKDILHFDCTEIFKDKKIWKSPAVFKVPD